MKNKAQIFSTDFLLAMIIILLGFGLIANLSELNQYNTKNQANMQTLKEKAETAAIIFTNSNEYDCNYGTTKLAYSINMTKLTAISAVPEELNKKLALQEYKLLIEIDTIPVVGSVDNFLGPKNIEVIDMNVLICDELTKFSDITKILRGEAGITNPHKAAVKIMVGK
jgi:cell division protein FtsI/penicillin-binding protein 2